MGTPRAITVLLADDHAVVRRSLGVLLGASGDFLVVGEAENGQEAVKMAGIIRPDVILMDISMPVLNGLDATQQILAANPSAKVIILSAHSDDAYVDRARAAGVAGFMEKHSIAENLTQAIRAVALGRTFFSPAIAQRRQRAAQTRAAGLTSRESEVLRLVALGSANEQIAAKLDITLKTVETHLRRMRGKFGFHEAAELTRFALAARPPTSSVRLTIT